MSQELSDSRSVSMEQDDTPQLPSQPVKIRKKPGRKPNPASPALRKAQNRAAQRAFRERKERHTKDLEVVIKQIREQRDKLHTENEQLKADQEILHSENWYLKGIVLTLQLVCFQHNLVIPQHGPYINEQALSVLAQSIPKSISTYISVNANNKLPLPSKLFGYKHTMKQRDRYLSTGSIVITKEGIHSVPDCSSQLHQPNQPQSPPVAVPSQNETSASLNGLYDSDVSTSEDFVHSFESQDEDQELSSSMPPLSPGSVNSEPENIQLRCPTSSASTLNQQQDASVPKPTMLPEDSLASNLAAIQTLRLRLRLQSACVRMDAIPFAIQPTVLQLTIPHDPRIDLIPAPHMRDRMILFRDQFDLNDCFRCLLGHSVFHGGDPAIASNWQLPPEFFEKFWFLTIDYDLRRTTNHWRRLQGLNELDFEQQQKQQEEEAKRSGDSDVHAQPLLEQIHHQNLNHTDISALLGIDFWKIAQQNINNEQQKIGLSNTEISYASSPSSNSSCNGSSTSPASQIPRSSPTPVADNDSASSFEPVRLTNGYSFPLSKPQQKHSFKELNHRHSNIQRHHPYQQPDFTEHSRAKQQHSPVEAVALDLSNVSPILSIDHNTCAPWETLLADSETNSNQDYDSIMENLVDTRQVF